MSALFPIGRIVTAPNQNAAIELFQNRKKLGIGGVIFTPEINIPKWTAEQKTGLAGTKLQINPITMQALDEPMLREVWKRNAGDVAFKLVELSKKFNHTNGTRRVWFIENDEINFTAHRDPVAQDGIIHLHCEGPGMICLAPTGPIPLPVRTVNAKATHFDPQEIKRLFQEGHLFPLALKPRQSIAFDQTMAHFSQRGDRFRILTLDAR